MGRYVLGDLLGRGGMAEVFSGYVNGLHGFQKPVAIKRLLPALASDHMFVERLIAEAKLLVGMQHGNIVSVLDLARDDSNVFVVMEYVDGPSLRQLLQARGSHLLSFGVITYIIQSAASGLEFAHARPGGAIIHADISPSNLLLTSSGEVRVADFGIARREGNFEEGVVEGKWAYMAPEQARGEPLSRVCDVFALGVVLYELLTGQHPIAKATVRGRAGGSIRIARPRMINPSVPPGLDSICMRALAEDPRDRFACMQHMIDALVDERFDNHWRDGANELAQAIREIGGGAPPVQRTLVTSRPITLMTRSLVIPAVPDLDEVSGPGTVTGFYEVTSSRAPAVIVAPDNAPNVLPRGSSGDLDANRPGAPIAIGEATPRARDPVEASASICPAGDRAEPGPDAAVFDGRPRWGDPKRNPNRVFAASLARPELATVHGGHSTQSCSEQLVLPSWRGKAIVALGGSVLLGVIVYIAIGSNANLVVDRGSRPDAAPTQPAAVPSVPVVRSTPALERPPTAPPSDPPSIPPATNVSAPPSAPAATPVTSVATAPGQADPVAEHDEPPLPSDPPSAAPRSAHSKQDAKQPAEATLRVNTIKSDSVWAFAYLDGQRQEVPGAKFKVPPGHHLVKLENPKLQLELSCTVTLAPHRTASLNVDLETGRCEVVAER